MTFYEGIKADLVESSNGASYVDKFIAAWGGNQ